ncbi:MAG: RcpC/CpaB family pilus assembly protein, partial [Chloroflexota bacterium]
VVIPPGAVELRPWPLAAAPFESFADPEEVIGRIARTDIFVEQPVLTNMVVDSLQDLADVGSDAAAILRPGTVAVAVPMDRVTSVAYAIQPGDRVNIMASFLFIDIDEQFQSALPNDVNLLTASEAEGGVALGIGPSVNGRFETRRIPVPLFDGTALQPLSFDWPAIIRPSEAPRPRLLVQQTIQNAQVMWTGDFPRDGILFEPVPSPTPVPATIDPRQQQQQQAEQPTPVPPRPDIVTLAVTPQEAVILTWMVEARIPITFSLRSAADASGLPTTPVTLDYILNEYDITVPARNDYSIQPAIRSIRQLLVGQTISLSN